MGLNRVEFQMNTFSPATAINKKMTIAKPTKQKCRNKPHPARR